MIKVLEAYLNILDCSNISQGLINIQDYQILFLGTGGGRFAVNKQIRSSGGIIVRAGGIQFHIDPGPGALVKAKEYGVDLKENKVLIASHCHLDHCNDVNVVISAMTDDGINKNGIFLGSKSVISGDNSEPILMKRYKEQVENYTTLMPGNKVKFGPSLELVATKTQHRDPTTVGVKLYTDKFVLGYTSDTVYFEELNKEFKGCDILIINTTKPLGETSNDHFSCDDAVNLIKNVKPRLAILTHFGYKMISVDPIFQAREVQKLTNVQTIAARDGMSINPITYSATLQHKTLNLY